MCICVRSYTMDNLNYLCTIVQMISTDSSKTTKGQERRRLILNTTLQMISSGGVDSISFRRVASAAGVPLGSTTYYFESRDHLIREAFDHYIDSTRKSLEGLTEDRINNASGLIDYLVLWTTREFADKAMLLTEYEMVLFAARDTRVAESLHQWDAAMAKDLASTLTIIGAKRSLEAAQIILHIMRGYELDSLSRQQPDASELRRKLELALPGLIAA